MSKEVTSVWHCPSDKCANKKKKGTLAVIHSIMVLVDMQDEKTGEIREEQARKRYRECSKCKDRYVTLETMSHKVHKRVSG